MINNAKVRTYAQRTTSKGSTGRCGQIARMKDRVREREREWNGANESRRALYVRVMRWSALPPLPCLYTHTHHVMHTRCMRTFVVVCVLQSPPTEWIRPCVKMLQLVVVVVKYPQQRVCALNSEYEYEFYMKNRKKPLGVVWPACISVVLLLFLFFYRRRRHCCCRRFCLYFALFDRETHIKHIKNGSWCSWARESVRL